MSEVSSTVEVPVDPGTAFKVFTEEVDLWWVRGPINFYSAGRAAAMRIEAGVGGRLLEVYDDSTGDALERGVITVWEPGERLAWDSTGDDVQTEVLFKAAGDGTLVEVVARIPEGGSDRGGTAWVRVVPLWFGPWAEKRDRVPHEVQDLARIGVGIHYGRPAAAARWLVETFGLEAPSPLPTGPDPLPHGEHGHPWIELRAGNSSVMIFPQDPETQGPCRTHNIWLYVDDVEAHYERSMERGVKVLAPLAKPWGLPFYAAEDLEGNRWTLVQARPTQR